MYSAGLVFPWRRLGWRRWRSPSPLPLRRKRTTRDKHYAHSHYAHSRYHHNAHYREGRQIIVHSQAPVVQPSYAWGPVGAVGSVVNGTGQAVGAVFYGAGGIVGGIVGGFLAACRRSSAAPAIAMPRLTATAAPSRRRSMRPASRRAPFQVVGGAFGGPPPTLLAASGNRCARVQLRKQLCARLGCTARSLPAKTSAIASMTGRSFKADIA